MKWDSPHLSVGLRPRGANQPTKSTMLPQARSALPAGICLDHGCSALFVVRTIMNLLSDFAYRLRPEQPPTGLEYISISAEARRPFLPKGVPLKIAVWNTFKGRRERYYDFL